MKINIKNLFSNSAILLVFLLASCSKDTTDKEPSTGPKQDILTTGWKKVVVDPSIDFSDIFFNSSTNGYVAGKKLYRSVDGGLTWHVAGNRAAINLGVTSNGKVFLVNDVDWIFSSFDGGNTLTSFSTDYKDGCDVFFVDDKNGFYMTFSGLYTTIDGGGTWTKLNTPDIEFGQEYSSFFFPSTNYGLILKNKMIYRPAGSLTKWKQVDFSHPDGTWNFQSIFITKDNAVYITTNTGELYKSTDGALSFSLVKAFPVDGGYFCDVHFVDNNTGYVSIGNKIFKTTDAGTTWNTVVALGEAVLTEIHFTDADHGWACGSKGTVLTFN